MPQLELPVYRAKRSEDFPQFLIVFCPRENCPGYLAERPFLVHERTWMRPHRIERTQDGSVWTIVGRSCPYCFATARIPSRREVVQA